METDSFSSVLFWTSLGIEDASISIIQAQPTTGRIQDIFNLKRPNFLCKTLIMFLNWFVISLLYYGLTMQAGKEPSAQSMFQTCFIVLHTRLEHQNLEVEYRIRDAKRLSSSYKTKILSCQNSRLGQSTNGSPLAQTFICIVCLSSFLAL